MGFVHLPSGVSFTCFLHALLCQTVSDGLQRDLTEAQHRLTLAQQEQQKAVRRGGEVWADSAEQEVQKALRQGWERKQRSTGFSESVTCLW